MAKFEAETNSLHKIINKKIQKQNKMEQHQKNLVPPNLSSK